MAKIKYGLKNVYYAKATIASGGTATYGSPVAIPGAVNLSLDQAGDQVVFYADDMEYYVCDANNGYSGTLEVALLPDSFRKDILGDIEDVKHVLIENAEAETVHFALMAEFALDASAKRIVLYNCTAQRPTEGSQTKGETIEPRTETLNITAKPIKDSRLNKNIVRASTKSNTDTTVYNGWFSNVYTPGTAST